MNKIKEKINPKIIIGIILIIVLIILFLIIKNHNNKIAMGDNGLYIHDNLEIVKDEEYKGVKFSNISMTTEDGYTTFICDVTNISESDIEKESYSIKLKDKGNNEVVTLIAYIPEGLKKGETKMINAQAQGEYKEVVSKEITD